MRRRLDQLLVDRGLMPSRARARDAILRGTVNVGEARETRPAAMVSADACVTVDDPAARYVSRAALKLVHGLDAFAIDVTGRECLDIGASTGGFTQVLLERGARRVTAVDVGHGQLAPSIRDDPRVVMIEGTNARDLSPEQVPAPPEVVVCDVSFISLTLALPPALDLAAPRARLIALIKPQFEAGREALDGRGVVRDPAIHDAVTARISRFISETCGWRLAGIVPSPVTGGNGNREFLLAAEKP
jgi:23S rRNA (cytidine1920-2'-O)/16S rRNA (cytidine1409-2'-O)-methyltransferase